MKQSNIAGMAIFALLTGLLTMLMVSFLPFFLREVWGPLWGAEWQPEGAARSFGQVGPFVGFSRWAAYLAVPLSGMLLLVAFVLTLASLVIYWRGRVSRAP